MPDEYLAVASSCVLHTWPGNGQPSANKVLRKASNTHLTYVLTVCSTVLK